MDVISSDREVKLIFNEADQHVGTDISLKRPSISTLKEKFGVQAFKYRACIAVGFAN